MIKKYLKLAEAMPFIFMILPAMVIFTTVGICAAALSFNLDSHIPFIVFMVGFISIPIIQDIRNYKRRNK